MLDFNAHVQKTLCFPCVIIQPCISGLGSLGLIETLDYFCYIINLDILMVGKYCTMAICLRKDFFSLNENVSNSLEGKVKRLKAQDQHGGFLMNTSLGSEKRKPKAERKENSMGNC